METNSNLYFIIRTAAGEALQQYVKELNARLSELKTDLAAQEKMLSEPFSKETELEQKRARFNEIMTELNPPEEQQISDSDTEDEQYQSREYLTEDSEENSEEGLEKKEKKCHNKHGYYSQAETLFLSWSNGSAPVGEVRSFVRFGKHHFYEKSENGCVELSAKQYEERKNNNVTRIDDGAERKVSNAVDIDESSEEKQNRNIIGNRNETTSEFVSEQTLGEELRNDTGGSLSGIGGYDIGTSIDGEQYQPRTGVLTNEDILEYAAEELDTSEFTAGEKDALEIFKKRLTTLRDLQEQRSELGRLYKEQQFGAKTDRAAVKFAFPGGVNVINLRLNRMICNRKHGKGNANNPFLCPVFSE